MDPNKKDKEESYASVISFDLSIGLPEILIIAGTAILYRVLFSK